MSNQVHLLEGGQKVYSYPEEDPNFEGNELHDEIRSGPRYSRGCNDILFILIFGAMWVGMVFLGLIGYRDGSPNKLLAPFDFRGYHCGYGVTKDYEKVYIISQDEYYCVISCPSQSGTPLTCYNCTVNSVYASDAILTLCYPNDPKYVDQLSSIINFQGSEKFFADLKNSWPIIAISAGVAFFLSIMLTFLIKWAASFIVWTMIFFYLALLSGLGTIAFYQSNGKYFQDYKLVADDQSLRIIAYVFWGIAAFSLLLVFCLFNKIRLAVAVLKAAADFLRDVFYIIFVPLFVLIVVLVFLSFWLVAIVYIFSSGDVQKSESTPFFTVQWTEQNKWTGGLYLIGLIWNIEFAIAFTQFVISSSACLWYFSHLGETLNWPVYRSISRGLFNHLGSLLLGSLILTVVWIIKFILDQIHKSMKSTLLGAGEGVADNQLMRCGLSYCKCLVKCFERFIRFLNSNAYIMIALSGQSFCAAAYDAFYLITRNILKVSITHGLGAIFQFFGTVSISASTAGVCYILLTEIPYFDDKALSAVAPTIAFVVVGYVVGALFMNLYGIGTDAILLCYLADYELNRDQGGAKSTPGSLKEFLHEYQ